MDATRAQLLQDYLNTAQLQLYAAHQGIVGLDWNHHFLKPEVNRLYYFQDGVGNIRVRNREYNPRPGNLFLLPAHVETAFSTEKANRFRKYYCHFTLTIGEIHLFQMFQIPHFVNIVDREWLNERFDKLIGLSNDSSLAASLQIKSVLYDILALYLELAQQQASEADWQIDASTPSTAKMNAVLSYIDEHISNRITIDELAGLLHFHPKYFTQLFKSTIGVSPIVYITKKRMEKAHRLLVQGQLSVTDIADQVGMDLYYFSHTFRKFMGLSPTEYRQYLKNRLPT